MDRDSPQILTATEVAEEEIPSRLSPRPRLLCIGATEPSWISLTLHLDAAGCLEPQFRWTTTAHETLAALRDESFDCILIADGRSDRLNGGNALDPFSLARAIRAGGCDDPMVLVSPRLSDDDWIEACRIGCELLATGLVWESRALLPVVERAIRRGELECENRRLAIAHHRRLVRERDEAEHLLDQQRQIIQELQALAGFAAAGDADAPRRGAEATQCGSRPLRDGETTRGPGVALPDELNDYYHELLRTYVIMGSGNLGGEIARLAELIALAGLGPREALQLHLDRVEALVRGLGSRSTRHIMARADLLALELMIHLGECYQRRLQAARSADTCISTEANEGNEGYGPKTARM